MAQDYGLLGGVSGGSGLLGGGADDASKWVQALAILGATFQDIGTASQGRQGGALNALNQRSEADRKRRALIGQQSAQATLLGGYDPTTGITWDTGRPNLGKDEQQMLLGRAFPQEVAEARIKQLIPAPSDWVEAGGGSGVPGLMGNPAAMPGGSPAPAAPSPSITQVAEHPLLSGRLAQAESGGNPAIMNKQGYVGKYQFGEAALQAAGVYTPESDPTDNAWLGKFNIPGMPGIRTIEEFRAYPEAQDAAWNAHAVNLRREIQARGMDRWIGQTVGGVPITEDALISMMHLGGPAGTQRFLTSGGARNPADANGTRLSDYGQRFGGGGPQPVQVAQAGTGTMTDAAPAPAAGPGLRVLRNQKTGEVQYLDGTGMPLPAPPAGYQYTRAGRLEAIPGGPSVATTEVEKLMAARDRLPPGHPDRIALEQAIGNVTAKKEGESRDFSQAKALRSEFTTASKNFQGAQEGFLKVQQAAATDSAAGDLALIFGYMKTLDPTSTVREGEFATAQNAGGIPDRIINTYNRIISGERLNPDQRTMFVKSARDQFAVSQAEHARRVSEYTRLAQASGVDPAQVIPDLVLPEMGAQPQTPGAAVPSPAAAPPAAGQRITNDAAGKAAYDALPSGATFIDPNGQTRRKP